MENAQAQTTPPALAAPKTDGMAVTSLVLGILGICCCFFTGIVAIILGVKSRKRIRESNGMLTGDGLALAGLITGCVSLVAALFQAGVLAGMLLPAIAQARENANNIRCASNLKQIGLACKQYAQDDKDGKLPPDMAALVAGHYLADTSLFRCPSSPAKLPVVDSDLERDYLYCGKGRLEMETGSDTVLLVDRPTNHYGMFVNVLFGDCHVEHVRVQRGADFRALAAQKGWKIPEPAGK